MITEWDDPLGGKIDLDGLIIEIEKNDDGQYDLAQWNEDEFWADKEKAIEQEIKHSDIENAEDQTNQPAQENKE